MDDQPIHVTAPAVEGADQGADNLALGDRDEDRRCGMFDSCL
jgi:hypothetical protein